MKDRSFYKYYTPISYCITGKHCYPTKTQAKKAQKECQLKYLKKYRVYECEFCNQFHLTTQEQRNKPKQ